jgi:hypothetical protein
VLRVGDDQNWYAHADLFIGNDAPRALFEPMASWLRARQGVTEPYAVRGVSRAPAARVG